MISTSDSGWAGSRFKKLISFLRVLLERARNLLPSRWIMLLVGVGCVAYSQYLIDQRTIQGEPLKIAEDWNVLYRLEIVNLSNVLSAIPYLLGGAILCVWTGLPSAWKDGFVNWSSNWVTLQEVKWSSHAPRLLIGAGLMISLLIQLGRHRYMPIYPFLWIIALWLFTLTAWKWDSDHEVNLSPGLSVVDLLWIVGIFAGGIGIGAYALQDIPAVMVADEGSFWEAARAIAIGEFHPPIFDSGVYSFPVASSIYQGWILRWFGVNFWGWRFSSVVAGVAAVIPLYLLAKEWFGRRTAVASAIMMVANPYFLSFARMGYNNIQSLFPVTLTIYFWALGSRRGSSFYLWLAGLTAGLGFYTYSAAWVGMVTLCLGMIYLRVLKQISWQQALRALSLILLAWGMMIAPRVAYVVSGNLKEGLAYKIIETSFVSVFYGNAYYQKADLFRTMPQIQLGNYPPIFYDPLIYSELLTRGVVRTFVALVDPYVVTEHFLISAFAGFVSPMFFVIGFALALGNRKQARFSLPLIWLISGLIFLSIISAFPPRHTHLVPLIPVMALISGMGLSAVIESLAEYFAARLGFLRPAIINALYAAVSLTILYYGAQKYFVTMPNTYPPSYEDYVSWVAWRTEKPIDLIYLGKTDIHHRVEYLVDAKVVPHNYRIIELDAFSPQNDIKLNMPTVIFAETSTKEELPFLQHPPHGFSAPVAFHDHDGNILGYTTTNSPGVTLELKAGFSSGWDSLINTPARNLLLPLLIGTFLIGAFALRKLLRLPRVSLEVKDQIHEEGSGKSVEGSDSSEVDFILRIRFPSRKRDQS